MSAAGLLGQNLVTIIPTSVIMQNLNNLSSIHHLPDPAPGLRGPGLLVQVQARPPQEGRRHRGQLRRQGGAGQERHAILIPSFRIVLHFSYHF